MNREDTSFDIIIVGGGMVGATFACALAGSGLRLAVVDGRGLDSRPAGTGSFDPRVSAITPASERLLQQLGVWDGIRARRSSAYRHMHVWDADGTGSIHFSAADIHADALGHIVENSVILAALHDRIRTSGNVTWIGPAALAALQPPLIASVDGVAVSSRMAVALEDGRALDGRLLVAADGGNSRIRELAGFRTREWDYEHHALVTTVRTELPHGETAIQRFMDEGVLAFLPLAGSSSATDAYAQNHCSIVWSVIPSYAEYLMSLDDDAFARVLQAAIENRLGTIEQVDSRHSFPLRQRHAADYVQPGIALIGDAAHTIHPLAGQGVNLGLMDAQVLAGEITEALSAGRDFAEMRTLRRYQRRRKGHNLGMMWTMEGFRHLFADQPLPVRWLRNAGMSGLDRLTVLKHQVMRAAMGIT